MAAIPERYLDLLESCAPAHMATIGPKGEPQTTPVWFGWDGTHVLLSVIKAAQKYQNLRRDPRIALSIIDPQNLYRYLEIRGRVARIEEDADRHFVNSLTKKYLNQEVYPWHTPGDERVMLVVEPEHTTSIG